MQEEQGRGKRSKTKSLKGEAYAKSTMEKDLNRDIHSEHVNAEDTIIVESRIYPENGNDTSKIMDIYSEIMVDAVKCTECKDQDKLREHCEEMELEIDELKDNIKRMEGMLCMKEEKIKLLQENLEHCFDENTRIKNNIKQLKENNRSLSDDSDSEFSDEDMNIDVDDFKSFRQDFLQFKKHVSDELAELKQNVKSDLNGKSEDVNDNASGQNDIDSNSAQSNVGWNIVRKEKRKGNMLIRSNSDSNINQIQISNRFSELNKVDVCSFARKTQSGKHVGAKTQPIEKISPGVKEYSKAHIRTTLILSDSTIGKLTAKRVRKNIDVECEEAVVNKHPGATAAQIAHYSTVTLEELRPQQVIIVAGSNDISRGSVNEYKVVDNILKIARNAKAVGAQKIFVSSVLVRWGHQHRNMILRVNDLLEAMCRWEDYIFIDHSDITTRHICDDGLHPNKHGYAILEMNILHCFYTFNPYIANFLNVYEDALF